MRLEIEGLGGGGRGVGRSEGRVVFVAGALPGELVEVEVERRRAGIVEARAVDVLRRSAWREPEPCPAAVRCGGCDLAHVRPEAVADALRAIVVGALRHAPPALAAAVAAAPVVVSPPHWRMRARLHWNPAARRLGFLGPRSHEVAAIDPCRVLSVSLRDALPDLAGWLSTARLPASELVWLETLDASRAVAGWLGAGRPPVATIGALAGCHRLGRDGESRGGWGDDSLTVDLPRPLRVPVGAFFQGNRHLVPRLFARIAALAGGENRRTVDLYGGVGLLGSAARHGGCDEVVVVEAQAVAAEAARRNLPGTTVVTASAECFLNKPGDAVGTLAIVDPPRQGLSAEARRGLLEWAPAAVLLLSCDAARFGRDAGALLGAGYRLDTLELWDLFGGTHHAEILAHFSR